jgi:hypothetical protein
VALAFGSQGALTISVNTHKNPLRQDDPGRTSWIADELIGIRTLEQRLCRKLKSGRPENRQYLLHHIQDLNWRVELLDRALDEYGSTEHASAPPPMLVD